MIKPYVSVQYKQLDHKTAPSGLNTHPFKNQRSRMEDELHLQELRKQAKRSKQDYDEILPYIRFIEAKLYNKPLTPLREPELFLKNCAGYTPEELYRHKAFSVHHIQPGAYRMNLKPRQEKIIRSLRREQPKIIPTTDGYGYSAAEYIRLFCHALQESYAGPHRLFAKCRRMKGGTRDYVFQLFILPEDEATFFYQKWVNKTHK